MKFWPTDENLRQQIILGDQNFNRRIFLADANIVMKVTKQYELRISFEIKKGKNVV